jgi:ubiquinone/menaquinone biosynthesis C-methylase UbiE
MLTVEEQVTLDTYNNIAPQWVSKNYVLDFWSKEYKTFQEFLPSGKIIDLGCGGGRDSVWFTKNGYEYIGVDISEGMIAEARKRHPKAEFLQQSLYNLDFPKNSFDGFWSACSLLHIPKDRIGTVLNNIKQILKPGAVGFISIKQGTKFLKKAWHETGKERFFAYYEQTEFTKVLTDSGFEILKTSVRSPENSDQDGTFLTFYVKLI